MLFAPRARPNSLFRYQRLRLEVNGPGGLPFDFDRNRLGSLSSLLNDGILYVPALAEFNDPWEGFPHFGLPRRAPAKALASFYVRLNQSGGTSPWEPHIASDLQRQIEALGIEAVLRESQRLLANELRPKRVLCLAESPDIALMWSYYAGGHTGYVIEFNATALPFVAAQPVKYSKKYPIIDVDRFDEPFHAISNALYVKAQSWKHESEWRIFGPKNGGIFDWDSRAPEPPSQGSYAKLPKGSVRRLIVGAKTDAGVYNRLRLMASRVDPPVPVVRCGIGTRTFQVVVPDA